MTVYLAEVVRRAYGEDGDDELNGASVADYLDGGNGNDTISVSAARTKFLAAQA